MSALTIAWFGDVVGAPGRASFAHAASIARSEHGADVIVVNGENARNGIGLHPSGYRELRAAGADAITLGDHCFADMRIKDLLADPEAPVIRPANLSHAAPGRRYARIDIDSIRPLYVTCLLGRLFMKLPGDNPFEALDRVMEEILDADAAALVLVELHAEATSEKIAMAWHALDRWPGRVVGVAGTHTHVQTADARVESSEHGAVGAITDLGMCGGDRGVIGRDVLPTVALMRTARPIRLTVTGDRPLATGALLTADLASGRATEMRALRIPCPAPDQTKTDQST